jgi:hypothetical protein
MVEGRRYSCAAGSPAHPIGRPSRPSRTETRKNARGCPEVKLPPDLVILDSTSAQPAYSNREADYNSGGWAQAFQAKKDPFRKPGFFEPSPAALTSFESGRIMECVRQSNPSAWPRLR